MIPLNSLKKGAYILHRKEPYEVIDMGIVVTGTHSHSKTKATVKGVFSGTTEVIIKSHHENVEELNIIRKKATVIAKINNSLQIMDAVNYETLEVNTDGISDTLHEGDDVTYIEFENKVKILGKR